MLYLIDGYNLLFSLLHIDDDLKKQREEILDSLSLKIKTLKIDVLIVFDAAFQDEEQNRFCYRGIDVIFTSKGQSADDFILQEVKHAINPLKYTVVTSDKQLSYSVRCYGGKTISINNFLKNLDKRYVKKEKVHSPKEEEAVLTELDKYYLKIFEEKLAKEKDLFNKNE